MAVINSYHHFINKKSPIKCCPFCSAELLSDNNYCHYCEKSIIPIYTKQIKEHYLLEACKKYPMHEIGLFGYTDVSRYEEMVTAEISKNPQFNVEALKHRIQIANAEAEEEKRKDEAIKKRRERERQEKEQEQRERQQREREQKAKAVETAMNPLPIPKCPTCGSTRLKKISAAKRGLHAWAFGIFSKTAFSQFECEDCGYKF